MRISEFYISVLANQNNLIKVTLSQVLYYFNCNFMLKYFKEIFFLKRF